MTQNVPQTEGEERSGHEQCLACGFVRPWFVSGCPACKDPRQGKPYDDVCPTCSGTGKEKA